MVALRIYKYGKAVLLYVVNAKDDVVVCRLMDGSQEVVQH